MANTSVLMINENVTSQVTTSAVVPPAKVTFHDVVNIYFMPIIMILGLIGNILIIIIMNDKAFHRLPMRVYFTVLAVLDSVVMLLVGLHQFLRYTTGIQLIFDPYICFPVIFGINISVVGSYWIIVCIGVDRFIVTMFPTKAKVYSSPYKAKIIIVIVLGMDFLIAIQELITRDLKTCKTLKPHIAYVRQGKATLSLFIRNVIPVTLLVFCYLGILRTVLKARNRIQTETTGKVISNITKTSLYICGAFIVFTVPLAIYTILRNYYGWTGRAARPAAAHVAETVVLLLRMFNHSTNILISASTNMQFRTVLKNKLFRKSEVVEADTSTGRRTSTQQ